MPTSLAGGTRRMFLADRRLFGAPRHGCNTPLAVGLHEREDVHAAMGPGPVAVEIVGKPDHGDPTIDHRLGTKAALDHSLSQL